MMRNEPTSNVQALALTAVDIQRSQQLKFAIGKTMRLQWVIREFSSLPFSGVETPIRTQKRTIVLLNTAI
jgi:hypothetical protein